MLIYLLNLDEGEEEDHQSVLKKVKEKAKNIKHKLTKHGHGHGHEHEHDHDYLDEEDDEVDEDPAVHGATSKFFL